MEKDIRDMLIIIGVVFVAIVIVAVAVMNYSGLSSPLTVVESNSMQHSVDESQISVIDTGDMVIMVSPEKKSVVTYVEGTKTGYEKFGSYGDVIIYKRGESKNPVIHRAIIELIYNGDDTWSAPSLEGYQGEWDNDGHKDYTSMTGTFTMYGLGWRELPASINLDNLPKHSGYLTNGDNNTIGNATYFDQATSIAATLGPIQQKDIKSIAGMEIPWVGCIKLYLNDKNVNMIPKNSLPCLIIAVVDIIMLFLMLSTMISIFEARRDFEEVETCDTETK